MSTIRHTIRLYKPSDEEDLNFLANLKIKYCKPKMDVMSSHCILYVKQSGVGGRLMDIDLEEYANNILECVDYDIYKEDVVYGEGSLRDEIEFILRDLVKDIRTQCE